MPVSGSKHALPDPPVQLSVRCPACGYERSMLALHAGAVERAMRCERCSEAVEVLGARHGGGFGCSCCS